MASPSDLDLHEHAQVADDIKNGFRPKKIKYPNCDKWTRHEFETAVKAVDLVHGWKFLATNPGSILDFHEVYPDTPVSPEIEMTDIISSKIQKLSGNMHSGSSMCRALLFVQNIAHGEFFSDSESE